MVQPRLLAGSPAPRAIRKSAAIERDVSSTLCGSSCSQLYFVGRLSSVVFEGNSAEPGVIAWECGARQPVLTTALDRVNAYGAAPERERKITRHRPTRRSSSRGRTNESELSTPAARSFQRRMRDDVPPSGAWERTESVPPGSTVSRRKFPLGCRDHRADILQLWS